MRSPAACSTIRTETPLENVLDVVGCSTDANPPAASAPPSAVAANAEVFDLELDGVRITLLPTAHSRAERAPSPREAAIYLDLAEQVLERFRPEILLTYGGHPVSRTLMLKARAKGTTVVFHLHNFGYNDRRGFRQRRRHHLPVRVLPAALLHGEWGWTVVVISDPIRLDKVIAENPEPEYVTFVNPQPEKGAAVFARIAARAWPASAGYPAARRRRTRNG